MLPEDGTGRPFPDFGRPVMTGLPRQPLSKGGHEVEEYERVCCYESLYQAHKLARRGKQNTREVILYEMRLSENIERLSYHLRQRTYRVRGYRRFRIHDPKEREIQALCYGDRIVQHSLCDNVLGPYLERHLVYDNSACRKGKGTHFALDRLGGFLRQYARTYGTEGYILKCDIRKYFPSIDPMLC